MLVRGGGLDYNARDQNSYLEVERRSFLRGELARVWLGPERNGAAQVEATHAEGSSFLKNKKGALRAEA